MTNKKKLKHDDTGQVKGGWYWAVPVKISCKCKKNTTTCPTSP